MSIITDHRSAIISTYFKSKIKTASGMTWQLKIRPCDLPKKYLQFKKKKQT